MRSHLLNMILQEENGNEWTSFLHEENERTFSDMILVFLLKRW